MTSVKSLASTPVTASLNVTSHETLRALVGLASTASIERTVGAVTSRIHPTVLSVELDAPFGLPTASVATPAPITAMTSPLPVMPVTATS